MELDDVDFALLSVFLEGFLSGLYSGIFVLYLHYHGLKKKTGSKIEYILFYALCALYLLSVATIFLDTTNVAVNLLTQDGTTLYRITLVSGIINGCCDFIAQFILIYRCWIVWNCNTRIIIIPSILAFAFLVIWQVGDSSLFLDQGLVDEANWGTTLNITSLAMSMTVNALVTGLIVFRIFQVFRQVKSTSEDQNLGATGGTKLRSIIFVIIESGMALFTIQVIRLVLSSGNLVDVDAVYHAYELIVVTHQMLNGITPTIILVRVSMGLSFNDEKSVEEVAESLRFASYSTQLSDTGTVQEGTEREDW